MLFLPKRRIAQPQDAVGPDWTNPLARGLRFLWTPQAGRDLVTGTPAVSTGAAPAQRHSGHGLGVVGAGSVRLGFGKRLDLGTPGTNTISYMAVLHLVNAATADGYIMGRITLGGYPFSFQLDGGNDRFSAGVAGGLTNVNYPTTSTAGQLDPIQGKDVVVLCVWDGATLTLSVRELGGPWGGSSSVSRSGTFGSGGGSDDASFELFGAGIDVRALNGANLLCGAVWNRVLAASESRAILANPWQLFGPMPRKALWKVFRYAFAIQSGAWTVRNNVEASQPGAWSVRNAAFASQVGAWSVRQFVAAAQHGGWSVRNGIEVVQVGAWSVRNFTAAAQGGGWSVRGHAAGTQWGAWSVRNFTPSAYQSGSWSVRGFAQAVQAGAWRVRGYVLASQQGAWSVGSFAMLKNAAVYPYSIRVAEFPAN